MDCPKCGSEMEANEAEPDVNVVAGWACVQCGEFVPEWDVDTSP